MRAVPFFHDAEPDFVTAIITKLEFEVYLEGDVIIREGELGTEMYFLKSGVVSVSCGGENADDLTDGSYFGGELIFSSFFFLKTFVNEEVRNWDQNVFPKWQFKRFSTTGYPQKE